MHNITMENISPEILIRLELIRDNPSVFQASIRRKEKTFRDFPKACSLWLLIRSDLECSQDKCVNEDEAVEKMWKSHR